ncbi:ABC transporter ATP-binding protein [Helicobacter aurati]|uniref:ABC transporter ATP-binding protein n=1 Tax=Helicobacter aurati TaxID=137778 RepID=A0A3D8J4G6_9HELI|nr:ABC transporter ATP-binding protein [Helicobacter aurati]RDU72379.1 ABC transporter ATP-binding protein [Helicobacter aurati]
MLAQGKTLQNTKLQALNIRESPFVWQVEGDNYKSTKDSGMSKAPNDILKQSLKQISDKSHCNNASDDVFCNRVIALHNVGLQYHNKWVLRHVDFVLQKGEFVAVLGDSGCGKSSLLNLIAGFLVPSEGEILLFNKPHNKPDSQVGVMFQDPPLYPWLKIHQNVGFALKMRGLSKQEIQDKSQYYLHSVGLEHKANVYPYECSGGMRSRAQLAQVLALESEVILMDEPFSALDAFSKRAMQDLIAQIHFEFAKAIFFITHDIDEALRLAHRIIVLKPYVDGASETSIVYELKLPFTQKTCREGDKEFLELKDFLYALIKEKYDYVI